MNTDGHKIKSKKIRVNVWQSVFYFLKLFGLIT